MIKQILSQLVSIKSFSGNEKDISKFIFNFFKSKNAKVFWQNKNVVVHINNHKDTALIYNVHMDTVKPQNWTLDPFELVEKNNKYYGLGVSDNKINIAILMNIYNQLKNSNIDIFLVFTVNEEIDGNGSKDFAEYFVNNFEYDKTYCVVLEPRNSKYLGIGNKGNLFFKIRTIGKPYHSSEPEQGINAVEEAFEIISELKLKITNLEVSSIGKTTISVPNTITGGNSYNSVPAECEFTGDIRTTELTHQKCKNILNKYNAEIFSDTLPYVTESDFLQKIFVELGINKTKYSKGSNDALFTGYFGIPTVVFGAGNEEACHIADEYCEIKTINKAKNILIKIPSLIK